MIIFIIVEKNGRHRYSSPQALPPIQLVWGGDVLGNSGN